MQLFTFRKNVLIIALTLICSASFAQKMVTLTKAGELSKHITTAEKYKLTSLTVSGPINGTDVLFLREMAGRDVDGMSTDGQLTTLDLSDANIVAGGANYYKVKRGLSTKYYNNAEDDVVGFYMFANCGNLTSVKLPKTAKKIELYAFNNCKALKECMLPEQLTEVGSYAFTSTALTEINFPSTLNHLNDKSFNKCSNLKTIRFTSSKVPDFDNEPFADCPNIEKVFVPESLVEDYEEQLDLPEEVEFVGEEPTTISSLSSSTDAVEVARYNAAGQRISRPVKGLNIIKLSDGKVIKHVVR
jgi:leucine rich repeat domain protein